MLALFQLRGQQELPYRAMMVAYEHHMKCDLTGYPEERPAARASASSARSSRSPTASTRRRRAASYQTDPLSPAAVLAGMRDNPRRGIDPVVVKAFINLLGIYPVGTLVVLDTFELAIVHSANPNPEALSRPIVRIVSDERGNIAVSRAATSTSPSRTPTASIRRTIIKTENPDRYGINVGDYFV